MHVPCHFNRLHLSKQLGIVPKYNNVWQVLAFKDCNKYSSLSDVTIFLCLSEISSVWTFLFFLQVTLKGAKDCIAGARQRIEDMIEDLVNQVVFYIFLLWSLM